MKAFGNWAKCALVVSLMLGLPLSVHASCDAPRRGPQGEQGLQGPPGPIFSNYVSAYTLGTQITNNTPYNILFTSQQLPPVGITHPVVVDFSQFQVQNTGVFLIGWTLTLVGFQPDTVTVSLVNATTNTVIQPAPYSEQSFLTNLTGFAETVSGQAVVGLTAGTSIQLQVHSPNSQVWINQPSIFITQISN